MGRQLLMLETEHNFDQPGHPGRAFQMAQIGLDGPYPEWRCSFGKDGVERADFNWITQNGAGAVGFNIAHFVRFDPGILQCMANHLLLGGTTRCGQTAAAPILVDHRTADHGQDRIAIGLSSGEGLEHDHATAFATPKTIGGRVKGFTAPIGGVDILLLGIGVGITGPVGEQNQVDPAGQGHSALTVAQTLARLMDGDQRGGTGRIDDDRRAGKTKGIGKATGRRAHNGADIGVKKIGGRDEPRLHTELGIVGLTEPNKDPGVAVKERLRHNLGRLQRFPADFQQEALLWIDKGCLARGDAKELGIKMINLGQKAAKDLRRAQIYT